MPLLWILILFPIFELVLLIKVGTAIGVLATLLLLVMTGVIGILLMRLAGLATALSARERFNQGALPEQEMLQGLMMFLGGFLLLVPGFISDLLGVLVLFPTSRRFMLRILYRRLEAHLNRQPGQGPYAGTAGGAARPQSSHRPDTIEGEYQRKDD